MEESKFLNKSGLQKVLSLLNDNFTTKKEVKNYIDGKFKDVDANGHEYVDMGECGVWAKYPVGLSNYNKGLEGVRYFQWGDTIQTSTPHDWEHYKFSTDGVGVDEFVGANFNKYCNDSTYGYEGFTDDLTILELEDDAAHVNMGGDWRMPTCDEFNKLWDSCNYAWSADYNGTGIAGYILTLKTDNTKQLFIPAIGWIVPGNTEFSGVNGCGGYWFSDIATHTLAYDFSFNKNLRYTKDVSRRIYGYGVIGYLPSSPQEKYLSKEEAEESYQPKGDYITKEDISESDWNAQEGEVGYIKNRPFYSVDEKNITLAKKDDIEMDSDAHVWQGVACSTELFNTILEQSESFDPTLHFSELNLIDVMKTAENIHAIINDKDTPLYNIDAPQEFLELGEVFILSDNANLDVNSEEPHDYEIILMIVDASFEMPNVSLVMIYSIENKISIELKTDYKNIHKLDTKYINLDITHTSGTSTTSVMSQFGVTTLIPTIVQNVGNSSEDVMSQSAVTRAIEQNKITIEQSLGASTTSVMSQKAVTNALAFEKYSETGGIQVKNSDAKASGICSFACGDKTTASGDYSHAEGYKTTASGRQSHAEGIETIANSYESHAEGCYTVASGPASHAEGSDTTASGDYSHAEGYHTTASEEASHAEGRYTVASGHASHAEGCYTVADNGYEHASGCFNISTKSTISGFGNSESTLFSVGNGQDNNNRHNTFEIKQNGDIYIANTSALGVFYKKPMIKLQDALASLGSIPDDRPTIETWVGTKAEYEALTPKNGVFYFIEEETN